jgi:hypothetical protein
LLICLSLSALDTALASLAAGKHTSQLAGTPTNSLNSSSSSDATWGWQQRLGLLGLLAPLLCNLAGLSWLFADVSSFERRYKAFHKVGTCWALFVSRMMSPAGDTYDVNEECLCCYQAGGAFLELIVLAGQPRFACVHAPHNKG